jgi:DNA adenine methylase
LLGDSNPHIIDFYSAIAEGSITPDIVRQFLNREGGKLLERGESHYYEIRERFNKMHQPLDFLFLNRAGFNGMIRFNRKGGFNIPFCRKPKRFAQAYVTKITNQVDWVTKLLRVKEFTFRCQSYVETLASGTSADMIYCDPPYIGRHVDYYNGWNSEEEQTLFDVLSQSPSGFILSTWHHNEHRANEYIESLWGKFTVLTREHFYHVGGREINRGSMIEALVVNYEVVAKEEGPKPEKDLQLALTGI